jgi:sporulation related protein
MADVPAEPETLRDLMKQPGMSIGVGLVALGCGGLLFAVGWLWSMPRSHPEIPPAVAVAAAPLERTLAEQRLPDPATALPSQASIAPQPGAPVVERSASPPETPTPQPTIAGTDVATADAAVVAPAAPVAEPPPSSQPMASTEPAAPDVATPAPAQPAPVNAAPQPPATGAKGYRLQLGAMRTPESAQQEWDRLQHQYGDVLAKLAYAAPRVDLGNRGVFYRIQAGPLADAAAADRACSELKRRGVGCILVKP